MKARFSLAAWLAGFVGILLLNGLFTAAVFSAAPLLSDFGYRHMKVNGQVSVNVSRPLLMVLVNYEEEPPPDHDADYFRSFIFDAFGTNSQDYANGFFAAMSLGRFSFSSAGAIALS